MISVLALEHSSMLHSWNRFFFIPPGSVEGCLGPTCLQHCACSNILSSFSLSHSYWGWKNPPRAVWRYLNMAAERTMHRNWSLWARRLFTLPRRAEIDLHKLKVLLVSDATRKENREWVGASRGTLLRRILFDIPTGKVIITWSEIQWTNEQIILYYYCWISWTKGLK